MTVLNDQKWLFVYFLAILNLGFPSKSDPYKPYVTVYSGKFTNVSRCKDSNTFNWTIHLSNIAWKNDRYIQYIYAEYNFSRTLHSAYLIARIERCLEYEYGCEDFQSWKFPTGYLCNLGKMENQFWSPLSEKITPSSWKKTCPTVLPINYRIDNGTINFDQLVKFYPDIAKYYWRGSSTFYYKNEVIACYTLAGYVKGNILRQVHNRIKIT